MGTIDAKCTEFTIVLKKTRSSKELTTPTKFPKKNPSLLCIFALQPSANMYTNLQEEELKLVIAEQFFAAYDCKPRIGKIDFCVVGTRHDSSGKTKDIRSLLWAEAKRGTVADIYKPLVQLILTIGKARTFDTYLPPPFLAAFDAEEIAFLPYREILPFLALNDFNWNVTPSDDKTREFGLLYGAIRDVLDRTAYVFRYDAHEKELREFIKQYLKVPSKPLPVIKNHRERKGSFFTPKIWVDLSQKYLADVLGENWQDEYYVWDCAAGTGNLLNGLTNKYNIWASTLDQQDVDVMKDRIRNGANLLESHVFQFDFLNDEFDCGKLPDDLLAVLKDPEKRKKLVIYINPPYAEAGNKRTIAKTGKNKTDVSVKHTVYERYLAEIGIAGRELYALFLARSYAELNHCIIAQFSTTKVLQMPNFKKFRLFFKAHLSSSFLIPAFTFDNVKGEFPIGFFIWDTKIKTPNTVVTNVYDAHGNFLFKKKLHIDDSRASINDWIIQTRKRNNEIVIGYMYANACDFQHNSNNYIVRTKEEIPDARGSFVTSRNVKEIAIYFAVRHSIAHTWINHSDQFYAPNDNWTDDLEFQTNCLTFMLFHSKTIVQSRFGTNHFIPFTEQEVNAQARFESHFMTDFMAGKLFHPLTHQSKTTLQALAEEKSFIPSEPLVFSAEATAVFDAGRELWRYYHAQPGANPNASYYDIREHFQGRNDKGKMNAKSEDKEYMRLLANLKEAMEALRLQIVPKVYEYGFLLS